MLPPGHASAGYLVAFGVASFFHLFYGDPQTQALLWYGFVLGALPDLDMFVAFFKTRSLVIENSKQSHRAYITHTPVFWICVAVVAGVVTHSTIIFYSTLFAPLSHLILDALQDDIRPLWPWSNKPFRILSSHENLALSREPFFAYWRNFLAWYVKKRTITAALEAVLMLVFVVLLLVG
ncbi:metal-dependent hydrolase [Candidatus Uhrbacteria bacterium]|nr:metal-dependent hydrolase [Candidatus Uhrbacteria bacterium]